MDFLVFRDEHAPLPCGDRFIAEKAERADIAKRAHMGVFVDRSERLGTIFDEKEAVRFAKREELIHLTRLAVEMNGEDRFRSGRDLSLNVFGIHLERVRERVDEDRLGSYIGDCIDRSDVSERGDDHLVAWLDPAGEKSQMEGDRSIAYCGCVGSSDILGERRFELENEFTFGGDPGSVDAFVDVGFQIASKIGAVNRILNGLHGGPRRKPVDIVWLFFPRTKIGWPPGKLGHRQLPAGDFSGSLLKRRQFQGEKSDRKF